MSLSLLDKASIQPTGYESLGDEQSIDLGTVGYCRLPRRNADGIGAEWCLAVMPLAGRLTPRIKAALLREAARLVGGSVLDQVENADDATVTRWASERVYRSRDGRFSRYLNTADTHKGLESSVSYVLETSSGSVPADLLSVI